MLSDEEGKAVQEMARVAGQSVDAVRDLGGFIAKYIGTPLEQAVAIWTDKLRYRRWENQIALAAKAKAFLAARGLKEPTRAIALNLALPLLEEASLADSEALQDRWATLLANAADSTKPEVRRAYVSILAELTSFDASILEKIRDADRVYTPSHDKPYAVLWTHRLPDEVLVSTGKAYEPANLRPDVALALTNLGRLGLIDSVGAYGGMAAMHWVSMTELGRQFVATCQPQYARADGDVRQTVTEQ
ncbi:MAG: Abi-alpha family protein [Propionivibrio sp.]